MPFRKPTARGNWNFPLHPIPNEMSCESAESRIAAYLLQDALERAGLESASADGERSLFSQSRPFDVATVAMQILRLALLARDDSFEVAQIIWAEPIG
jgi:hypothetical protein